MTDNNESELKKWSSNHSATIMVGIAILGMVYLEGWYPCTVNDITAGICDVVETMLIVLGATMGALIGLAIHQHEKNKNNNNTPPE